MVVAAVVFQLLSCVWLFVIPLSVAHQASLSMGFLRQEYWSGLPFPSPGESSWPRDWTGVSCPAPQVGALPLSHRRSHACVSKPQTQGSSCNPAALPAFQQPQWNGGEVSERAWILRWPVPLWETGILQWTVGLGTQTLGWPLPQ